MVGSGNPSMQIKCKRRRMQSRLIGEHVSEIYLCRVKEERGGNHVVRRMGEHTYSKDRTKNNTKHDKVM